MAGLILGVMTEGVILYSEVLSSIESSDLVYPLWLLSLWIALFILLPLELNKVLSSPMTSIFFGVIGGPISYFSGVKLGAMKLISSEISLIIYTAFFGASLCISLVFFGNGIQRV